MSRVLLLVLLVVLPSTVSPQGTDISTTTASLVTSTSLNSSSEAPSPPPSSTQGPSAAPVVISTTAGSVVPSEVPPANATDSPVPPVAVNISTTVGPVNATSAALVDSSTTTTANPDVTSATVPPPPEKPVHSAPSFAVGSFFSESFPHLFLLSNTLVGLMVGVIITLGAGAGIFLFRKRNPSNASVGYRPYP